MAEDRIGFDGGDTNFYRYVGNNPVRFRDPSGNKYFNETAETCKADAYTSGKTCKKVCNAATNFGLGIATLGCAASGPGAGACMSAVATIKDATNTVLNGACEEDEENKVKSCGPSR